MASILNVQRLQYAYHGAEQPIFSGLDLAVADGEFVAIMGQSGVGKSTLLRCIAGLVQPEQGRVQLQVQADAQSRAAAFVFQDTRLIPWRRVGSNVAYGLHGLQLDARAKAERVQEALALTLVEQLAQRWPAQLSGGQAQRVGIARALAVHPRLLLMDEPFSAVDAITRHQLQDELLRIWQRTRPAVLFVTHDIEEAVYLADRVVVLGNAPAHVVLDQPVGLPRPRQRETPALQALARTVACSL